MTRPTASTAYGKIVEDTFGTKTFKYGMYHGESNNVTGALRSAQYRLFTDNFTARLRRLQDVYRDEQCRGRIIEIVNEIASSRNWMGAFGEITAVDFFINPRSSPASFLLTPVSVGLEVPANRLLKGVYGSGQSPSEIDGYFADFGVFYDAKVLKDNVREVLDGIYKRVVQKFPKDRLHIVSDFTLDGNCDVVSNKCGAIEEELVSELGSSRGVTCVKSKIVPDLLHRIIWNGGVQVTGNAFSPHRLAQEIHHTVFSDAHQFVTDRPFILVYVTFPWFGTQISPFRKGNTAFYRAIARRVFCQYKNVQRTLGESFGESRVKPSVSNVPVSIASRNLSALIFLEDNCILAPKSEEPNISAYLYMNPNCENSLSRSLFRDYAQCDLRFSDIDDFEYDNY